MSESFTLYKLIILYMLDKVDFPLTNAQLSDFILDQGYTTYFTLQQAINELLESELIGAESVRNSSFYQITQEGRDTLEFFGNRISETIRSEIDDFLKEKKYELRNEVSVIADYYKTTHHDFEAHCMIRDRTHHLIELSLAVPTEEQAEAVCNQWKAKSQDIYAYLISELIGE
ncbi:DUF4364 family protein [Diplocloster agilis]|uniref:DUF4364 family protein n=1 Tax=Diplocloster agilis TaxID=2850323 RepID=A0A949K478_9FIRM|nr:MULTISPECIES: DUF4364 family protein [Lachnospiraceae]MBU9739554.1 DUF4364 family protein [Diplocloster agilis]MBU9745323.1 DUF4364 family protein [Diplocloster agilis]MCU6735422.1 DUF4364 family protein [Suonthocola fibrivorans]SCJ73497.1 Uncharacterised protein [uncultured Clostridium sp.]